MVSKPDSNVFPFHFQIRIYSCKKIIIWTFMSDFRILNKGLSVSPESRELWSHQCTRCRTNAGTTSSIRCGLGDIRTNVRSFRALR